jgi:Kef-type K+ transport system membrane component KefB
MSSSISNLKALLPLSTAIALTGLTAPIALSFVLVPLSSFPPLHAFAAGSALSSTSLGTVLAVLQPSTIGFDLRKTKFGTALLSAAVMDDIVAFILVKVLSILGTSGETSSSYLGGSIGRAIGVTVGLGLALFALARWAFRPGFIWLKSNERLMNAKWGGERLLLILMATLFIGMVAAAGYGGTSPLYGAYIAGLAVAYLSDIELEETKPIQLEDYHLRLTRHNTYPMAQNSLSTPENGRIVPEMPSIIPNAYHPEPAHLPTLIGAFEHYITPVLMYLLLPLFFGSIGYSIPFVPLWRGRIIWRGIVYSILMVLGKAFCGAWMFLKGRQGWRAVVVLGTAMVSRGEIGLLWVLFSSSLGHIWDEAHGRIAQVARGTEDPLLLEDEFLVIVWAIVLCTIVGPMSVGWAVKRWGKTILRGGWE